MIILIPLGGIGSRFKKLGYQLPKPLINVMGKPILYWLLDNLNFESINKVVIPYNKEIAKYRLEDRLKKYYPKLNFIFYKLNKNTDGAAETIQLSLKYLNNLGIVDSPILCLDGDNFYTQNIIKQWNGDNSVYCFEDNSNEEIYSYVKLKNNQIIDIAEKQKISNLASTGGYGFLSWKQLQIYCQKIIDNNIKQKNEYYTSTVIKIMIQDNIKFIPKKVNINNYICLGTPLHVRIFCNNFPVISANSHQKITKSKRYCFDLDNTLVSFPKIYGDYTTVEPITNNINFVRYLKKIGHIIIIYTARRMKTHCHNQGKVLADIGKITFDTLSKFNIPYDEIYFGKPYADFYIDDLAISSYQNLEKELGYYQSNIDTRDFNQINLKSIQVYRKSSNNLSGEIYYFNHIPNSIKDMFPLMIDYDYQNFSWYDMEKINGIPISYLYLSEEFGIKQLDHVIGSIKRIQSCSTNETELNIYANYLDKLEQRYSQFDYSKFENSEKIYQELVTFFKNYQDRHLGKRSVIHGDPVLTNILINQFGKIKFIDMRGIQGSNLSIEGDWLYDWAKLYQSLIGYDEILENKQINLNYKNKLINHFELLFKNDLQNIKVITKLLLFTLIPLHNNEKCYKYYELLQSIE